MIGSPDHMKRALLERSVVLDAEDRDGLLAELRGARAWSRRSIPTGLVRVAYEGDTAQPLIGRIRTPLRVLRVHEPSLEEAYVELLARLGRRQHEHRHPSSRRRRRSRRGIRSGLAREANATFAIAWREILSAIRNPVSIAVTVLIP